MQKSDIADVLSGLLASVENENTQSFLNIAAHPAVADALQKVMEGDVDGFYFALTYPLQQAVDGLLQRALPGKHKAQFLFRHGSFVESHLKRLFDQYDGRYGCADKARTVISRLLDFFLTGREITFNYAGEYTYHLPNRILREHGQIVELFEGLYGLYYGNPTRYLVAMKSIVLSAQRAEKAESAMAEAKPNGDGSPGTAAATAPGDATKTSE